MKKIALVSIALFLLAASAAVAQDVRYKFDNNADFSKFKTYKWVLIKDAANKDTAKVDDLWTNRSRMLLTQNSARKVLPKPMLTPPISTLAIWRESAQRYNSVLTIRAGDMVRVGRGAVGTEVGAA